MGVGFGVGVDACGKVKAELPEPFEAGVCSGFGSTGFIGDEALLMSEVWLPCVFGSCVGANAKSKVERIAINARTHTNAAICFRGSFNFMGYSLVFELIAFEV